MRYLRLHVLLALTYLGGSLFAEEGLKTLLPPPPVVVLSAQQEAELRKELAEVTQSFQRVKMFSRAADIDIFLKAVRYALEFHEWYDGEPEVGMRKALELLAEARARIKALTNNEGMTWLKGSGFKVLGFYSKIDDSPQPYGVEIPQVLEEDEQPVAQPGVGSGLYQPPVWMWLHDRDEKLTDLHFIHKRLTAKQPELFSPRKAIIIHPFGRYCNGWKFAGETDVMECLDDVMQVFMAHPGKVALAGFGMGGTGALHLGAHHAAFWACVHTGGGAVEVHKAAEGMPWYEQKLWGMYDAAGFMGRFLNLPLMCYCGELDPQRRSMEEMLDMLEQEGLHPQLFIGPGMRQRYDQASIREVQAWMERAVAEGANTSPEKVRLQTSSWRYSYLHWLQLRAVEEQWEEARVDAEIKGAKKISVKTSGVRSFEINDYKTELAGCTLSVDDQEIQLPQNVRGSATFTKVMRDGELAYTWQHDPHWDLLLKGDSYARFKEAGTCMDDVFFDRFIFVMPDGPCEHLAVDAWVRQESAHAVRRWRSLMRGDPKVMTASEYLRHAQTVHEKDQQADLVLWGDAKSNPLIAMLLRHKLTPLKWDAREVRMGGVHFDAATHVPLMLFPNECIPRKRRVSDLGGKEGTEIAATGMILINSGLTFREGHDTSSTQQNPKLPDWAILDITQPPDAMSPGKVVAADFFDEFWRVPQKGKE